MYSKGTGKEESELKQHNTLCGTYINITCDNSGCMKFIQQHKAKENLESIQSQCHPIGARY